MPWQPFNSSASAPGGLGGHGATGGPKPCDTIYLADLPSYVTEEHLQGMLGHLGAIVWSKVMQKGAKTCALVQFSSVAEATDAIANKALLDFETPPIIRFAEQKPRAGGKGGGWGGAPAEAGSKGIKGIKGGYGPVVMAPSVVAFSPYGDGGKGGGKKGGGGDMGNVKRSIKKAGILPKEEWEFDEGSLFVSGLPPDTTDCDLYEIFAPFGAITPSGVKAMRARGNAECCNGTGFVDFIDPIAAQAAMSTLSGYDLDGGNTLQVSLKTPGKKKGLTFQPEEAST